MKLECLTMMVEQLEVLFTVFTRKELTLLFPMVLDVSNPVVKGHTLTLEDLGLRINYIHNLMKVKASY